MERQKPPKRGFGSILGGAGGGIGGGAIGSGVGGPLGTIAGSTVGGAAGSAIGNVADQTLGSRGVTNAVLGSAILGPAGAIAGAGTAFLGGNDKIHREGIERNNVLNSFSQHGLTDKDGNMQLPDGSTWNTSANIGHDWKYGDKRVNDIGDRQLHSYETDYTNDLDYLSSMAGTSLTRLLSGGKGKATDQAGQSMGNAFLGSVGYGQELNQKNFTTVMNNARSKFAAAGINSKEDFQTLTNKAFSEGRINDADHAAMNQASSMVFDNDYNLAKQLSSGRWEGLKTASKSPSDNSASMPPKQRRQITLRGQNGNTVNISPVISAQEALQSVKPFWDYFKQEYPGAIRHPDKVRGYAADAASLLGGVTAAGGLYKGITGGNLFKDVVKGIQGLFGGGGESAPNPFDLGSFLSDFGSADANLDLEEIGATDFNILNSLGF